MDVRMSDIVRDACEEKPPPVKHYVVAVDFGTVFSSVAFVSYTHEDQRKDIALNQIELVGDYPDWVDTNVQIRDVPTELWYPNPGHQADGTNSFMIKEQMADEELYSEPSDDSSSSQSDSESESSTYHRKAPKPPTSAHTTPELFWGYSVAHQLDIAEAFDSSKRVGRFKLLLHTGPESAKARALLEEICVMLRKNGLIKDDTDLIAHYLEQLFKHTRSRLEEDGYTEDSKVEFVLCVPAIWKARASRKMQTAMAQAIQRSNFGKLQNKSIEDLFIVSEPEAAATAAVQSNKAHFRAGETVLILDAGGATVDAATYTVGNTLPLRFEKEVVELGGGLCGSTCINERYEELLVEKLKDEHYLWQDGDMSRFIDRLVIASERIHKKKLDEMFPDNVTRYYIPVPGLRPSKRKNILPNRLGLRRCEIRELFRDSVEKVAEVMEQQIRAARSKEGDPRFVTKVVLMGGYGRSRSLAAYLESVLANDPTYDGIELKRTQLMSSDVARGAVLRALRKDDGPDRVLECSYGFLRSERYMDQNVDKVAHAQQVPWKDPVDGLEYIENTIRWDFHKGLKVGAEMCVERDVEYTFHMRKIKLVCTETLFCADQYPEQALLRTMHSTTAATRLRESHYRYTHEKNSGVEVLAEVSFDVSHLKNTDMVKMMPATGRFMFPYWKVFARLFVIIEGRNMRYEVRLRNEGRDVPPRAVGQESLAPAFLPGTA